MRVELRATVSPSEDPDKVLSAMKNVLSEGSYQVISGKDSITIVSRGGDAMEKMRNQLRDRRVRGAARRLIGVGTHGRSASIMLNRQAAFRGIIALCSSEEESPLGPIYMTFESDDLEAVTGWLTG